MSGLHLRNRWRVGLACLTAVAVGAGGSSLVYGGTDTAGAPDGPPVDRTPSPDGQSLQARTETKHGTFGVLLYRNAGGQKCMAAGRVEGDQVGSARGPFKALPLERVGLCDLHTSPAAVSIIHTREETTIYGLAADDVTAVEVRSDQAVMKTQPASDHAFIVNTPTSLQGPVRLTATLRDGTTQTINVADLPSWDEINNATPPPWASSTR